MHRPSILGWRLILIAALYAGVVGALIGVAPLPGSFGLAAGGSAPESLHELSSTILVVSGASGPLVLVGALLLLISRRLAGLLVAGVVALNVVAVLLLGVEAFALARQAPDTFDVATDLRAETMPQIWASSGLFLLAFALLLPLAYAAPQRAGALSAHPREETAAPGGGEPGTTPAAAPAAPVDPATIRQAIRRRIAAGPAATDGGESTLRLAAARDAAFADALATLPERHGRGGAILGELLRETGSAVDPVALARMVAAALLLAPAESPDDDEIEALALRIAAVNADAARELALAHKQLGRRFSVEFSLPRVLHKYGVAREQLEPSSYAVRPRAAEVERLLAEGRLAQLNDMLRAFDVIVLERIGSVAPVFRIDDGERQRVLPAADLLALLDSRAALR